jgi:hypothetical protein
MISFKDECTKFSLLAMKRCGSLKTRFMIADGFPNVASLFGEWRQRIIGYIVE